MTAGQVPFGSVPLVGREAELEEVTSALSGATAGAVLIAGSAGVGKSRLAMEAATTIASGGARATAYVIATEASAATPFGPFAPLMPDVSTLSEHPLQLMQQVTAGILKRGEGTGRLLLVVDDVHLLDTSSASLVHQLVQTRSCDVLGTMRTPGPAPEPISSLWKEGLSYRIDIQALSQDETAALAASFLGGPVAGSALRWLWDASGGNPLFIRELLVGSQESGAAYTQEGIWFLRLPLPAPSRLRDLITSRLSHIAPKTAEVVDLLAIGEPLGVHELVAIAGPEAVEDAENHGLILIREDERRLEARLSHPIYGEMLRAHVPRIRMRRLSAKLAEALEATGARRRDDVMRIAGWRLDSGSPRNPELLESAARRARTVRDLTLAARFARAALSCGGGVTAGLVLGEAEFLAGRHAEAEKVLSSMVPHCHTDDERSLIANARAYNLGVLMGDEHGSKAIVDEALSAIREPAARRRLLSRQASTDLYAGRLEDALSYSYELLVGGDELAVRRGAYVGSLALALLGRNEQAVRVAYAAIDSHRVKAEPDEHESMTDIEAPEHHLVGAVIGHLLGGRLAAAESDARIGRGAVRNGGDGEREATFCMLQAWVQLERGLVTDAAKLFRESVAINRDVGDGGPLLWSLGGVALAEAMAGNTATASAALSDLTDLPRHWMAAIDPFLVHRGRAWVLLASGQLTAARTCLQEAATAAQATGQVGAEAVLWHELVRLGEAKLAAPRLRELSRVIEGELAPAFSAHAEARLDANAAAMRAVAERFEGMGAMLMAAEAAHVAANLYTGEGQIRQASAMARDCTRLRDLCGGVASPLLLDADVASPLTRRELEIALLVASGLSSKAVAERLFVSARTVDNHLQRVYSKLGVTNRVSLEAALVESGLQDRR